LSGGRFEDLVQVFRGGVVGVRSAIGPVCSIAGYRQSRHQDGAIEGEVREGGQQGSP
jgi:hypothetical protein